MIDDPTLKGQQEQGHFLIKDKKMKTTKKTKQKTREKITQNTKNNKRENKMAPKVLQEQSHLSIQIW